PMQEQASTPVVTRAPAKTPSRRAMAVGAALAAVLLLSCGLLVGWQVTSGGRQATVQPTDAKTGGTTVVEASAPSRVPKYWDAAAAAKPSLAIEAEGHTAAVKKVFLRDQGRQAITVSLDKTVRIWDVETGDLIHTLRLPSGPGERGQIEAAALSADESIL